MDRWLLHDVRVLDEAGSITEPVDVTVSGGVVTGVGPNLSDAEATVADLAGSWLMPGVFDAIVLDQDPGDPAIFERPGAVAGVFKAGAPVVPHPRVSPPE